MPKMATEKPWRASIAWAVAVGAGAAALPLAILLSGRTLSWRDTARLFGPVRGLVVEALRDLRLPLWNPFEGLGYPLHAQVMHAVLHPVSVAAAFLTPNSGMDPLIVGHLILAALGAFVLAHELGASPASSAVAGFGYGMSGYVVSMSSVVQYLSGAGSAPWTVAAIHAAARNARLGIPLGAAAIAIQVFAGDPQWLIVASMLGIALAWVVAGRAGLARAAASVGLGAAIGGIQLIPAAAYFWDADRSEGLQGLDLVQWSLAPARILEFGLPGLFFGFPGDHDAPVFQLLGGPSFQTMPFTPSVFLGMGLIWLAIAGARGSRTGVFFAAAAGVCIWVALGPTLGATQILRAVPVWGAFRYSEKLVGPLALCLAVLAALGVDRIAVRPRNAGIAFVIAGAMVALAAVITLAPSTEQLLRHMGAGQAAGELRLRLGTGLGVGSLSMALLGLALGIAARPDRSHLFPALSVVAVLVASAAAIPFAMHAGVRLEREDDVMEVVRRSAPFPRIVTPAPATSMPAGLDDWDRLRWTEERLGMPAYSVDARVGNIDGYSGILPKRYGLFTQAFRSGQSSIEAYRRLGVTHVVKGSNDAEGLTTMRAWTSGGKVLFDDPRWGVEVWQTPHRPWAAFVAGARSVKGREEALRVLSAGLEAGNEDVVLEGALPREFSMGKVIQASRSTEQVRIEAETSGPGLLVINEAWSPGWNATLDGFPVTVHPADVLARAIIWPAGRHVLEMRYEPSDIRLGYWITVAGVIGTLMIAGRSVRDTRRKGS
jgi:hypothetical protein